MSEENKNGRALQGNSNQQDKNKSTGNQENPKEETSQPVNKNPKDPTVNRAKPEVGNSKTAGTPEMETEHEISAEEEQETDAKAEENNTASDKTEDSSEKENEAD
jgi:hypothetical protein